MCLTYIEPFGVILVTFFNICLIVDLIIMIKEPFSDKTKYMKFYVIFSVTFSFGLTFLFLYKINWGQFIV